MEKGVSKMDLFHILAEEKIKQAYKDGEFDNLPGMGKPLKLDDMSGVPEELRMAYRIMKNAGYTEEETVLRKELMTIEDLIHKCDNDDEKEKLQKQLNEKLLRFNRVMSKRGVQTNSAMFKKYRQNITKKFQK
jgi:hypothetical protein